MKSIIPFLIHLFLFILIVIIYSIMIKSHFFLEEKNFFFIISFENNTFLFNELQYLKNISNKNLLNLFHLNFFKKIFQKNNYLHNHILFISIASASYLNNMKYCIKSALKNGIKANEFIIFSLDEYVHQYFLSNNLQTFFINYSSIFKSTWHSIGRLKQVIQYYFNCLGVDVLFFESDMIFNEQFKNDIIQEINYGDFDISLIAEVRYINKEINLSNNDFAFNIGLMFVKSSKITRLFFRHWINECFSKNSWDQLTFINIIRRKGKIFSINQNKQYIQYHFFFEGKGFNLKIHFLNPIKYINYCNLIKYGIDTFDSKKINSLLLISKEMQLKSPMLLHYACITGKNKFSFINNLNLSETSYLYHMNHLKHFYKIYDKK